MIVFLGASSLFLLLELSSLIFLGLYLGRASATIKQSLIRRLDLHYAV